MLAALSRVSFLFRTFSHLSGTIGISVNDHRCSWRDTNEAMTAAGCSWKQLTRLAKESSSSFASWNGSSASFLPFGPKMADSAWKRREREDNGRRYLTEGARTYIRLVSEFTLHLPLRDSFLPVTGFYVGRECSRFSHSRAWWMIGIQLTFAEIPQFECVGRNGTTRQKVTSSTTNFASAITIKKVDEVWKKKVAIHYARLVILLKSGVKHQQTGKDASLIRRRSVAVVVVVLHGPFGYHERISHFRECSLSLSLSWWIALPCTSHSCKPSKEFFSRMNSILLTARGLLISFFVFLRCWRHSFAFGMQMKSNWFQYIFG